MTEDEVRQMLAEMQASCEYSDGTDGEESDVESLIGYKDTLEDAYAGLLRAAPLPEAIQRVQTMHDELGPLPADAWETMVEEELHRHAATLDTLDAVLALLQSLAAGLPPAQGDSSERTVAAFIEALKVRGLLLADESDLVEWDDPRVAAARADVPSLIAVPCAPHAVAGEVTGDAAV